MEESKNWCVPEVMGCVGDEIVELGVTFQDRMKGKLRGLKDKKKLFLERQSEQDLLSPNSSSHVSLLSPSSTDVFSTLSALPIDPLSLPVPAEEEKNNSPLSPTYSPLSPSPPSSSSSSSSVPFDYSSSIPPSSSAHASSESSPPPSSQPVSDCCCCASSSSSHFTYYSDSSTSSSSTSSSSTSSSSTSSSSTSSSCLSLSLSSSFPVSDYSSSACMSSPYSSSSYVSSASSSSTSPSYMFAPSSSLVSSSSLPLSRDACPSSFTSRSSASNKKKRSPSLSAKTTVESSCTPRFFHVAPSSSSSSSCSSFSSPPSTSSIQTALAELLSSPALSEDSPAASFSISSSSAFSPSSSSANGKVVIDLSSEQDFISFGGSMFRDEKKETSPAPHSFDGPRELLAPWAVGRSYKQPNMSLRLHEELLDFFAYMSATPEEEIKRQQLLERLTVLIQSKWPTATVQPFGSFVSKLYLPFGDLDLVVFGIDEEFPLEDLADVLKKAGVARQLQVVSGAKIPIIKFKDIETGVAVDICLEQTSGIESTEFVRNMQLDMPAMRPLVLFLKYFLYCRSLHDTYTGGVGSYLLQIMVTNFLQLHPSYCFKPNPPASRSAQQDVNLGCLLMSFMQLYGHDFNYHNVGLSVQNKGSYFNKSARGWFNPEKSYLIAVENPLAPDLDIGKNAWGIQKIQKAFKYAIHRLSADNTGDGSTLLSQIVSIRRELLIHRPPPAAFLPQPKPKESKLKNKKKGGKRQHNKAEPVDLQSPPTKKKRKVSASPASAKHIKRKTSMTNAVVSPQQQETAEVLKTKRSRPRRKRKPEKQFRGLQATLEARIRS